MIELTFKNLSDDEASALISCHKSFGNACEATNTSAPVRLNPVVKDSTIQNGVIAPVASVAPVVPVVPSMPTAVPTVPVAPAPTYDIEALGRAAGPLAMQGRQQELLNLLHSFGVNALTELPKERYGEMALKLREMGAQI